MFERIVFPIDINDKKSWRVALPKVLELCKQNPGSQLDIVTVVQTYGLDMMQEYFPKNWAKEISKKSLAKLKEIVSKNIPKSFKVNIHVDKGIVYKAILDRAEKVDADLIVMVAHHPDRSDYLLGPNVAKVARHSTSSVMIIRD